MKYIISESRLNSLMTRFMDDYLSNYEVIDNGKTVIWGEGKENQILYDIENELLFVRESLWYLVRDLFSVEHHDWVVFIKSYMANKGYFVQRLV